MERIRLGRTNLMVSRVAFGGIPIQRLSEEEAVSVVRGCIDLGVNFIDTANGYTTSEERIGKAIKGIRKDVIIATKTGARDRGGAMKHLELSLRRLQTDYIDIWQFHNPSTDEAYEKVLGPGGAMEAAQKALKDGKVRHIGISNHSMEVALRAVRDDLFDTVQFPFNFVTDEAAEELIPLCRQRDIGFIAMKPMAGGLLEDARIAFRYLLQFDDIVPDPGIETVNEMEQIVEIVNEARGLTPEDQAEIERRRAELGTRFCRRCEYCLPCPQKINIPLVMNIRSFWKRFPAERFFEGWIPDAMKIARSCVECGECEEKCPYNLPIRQMIKENTAFFDGLRR